MSEAQYDNYCLIPHPHRDRVLMLRTPQGWTLPQHTKMEAPEINRAMREELGLKVILLRVAYDRYKDEEREEQHIVYAMENHSPASIQPRQGEWIASAQLSGRICKRADTLLRSIHWEIWYKEARLYSPLSIVLYHTRGGAGQIFMPFGFLKSVMDSPPGEPERGSSYACSGYNGVRGNEWWGNAPATSGSTGAGHAPIAHRRDTRSCGPAQSAER